MYSLCCSTCSASACMLTAAGQGRVHVICPRAPRKGQLLSRAGPSRQSMLTWQVLIMQWHSCADKSCLVLSVCWLPSACVQTFSKSCQVGLCCKHAACNVDVGRCQGRPAGLINRAFHEVYKHHPRELLACGMSSSQCWPRLAAIAAIL